MVLSLAVNSEQIATALASEQQDHLLQHALQARYPLVSRLVELDETQTGKQLLDFIVLYIEAVPKLTRRFNPNRRANWPSLPRHTTDSHCQ